MQGREALIAMLVAGSVALGGGLSLAATAETKAPEAAKTPAVSTPAATSVEKEAKETRTEQQKETKAEQQTDKTQAMKKSGKAAASDRIMRGEVTAVEPMAKTLSVKGMIGKKEETLGVEVPDTAKISEGKTAKTLADVKIGDKVWMKYDHMSNNKFTADEIRLLAPQKAAATKKSS